MLLRYFYDKELAQASYLVGCQETGEAIVVDPSRDIEPYLDEAEAEGLRIVAATETHIHADFLSGARELAERTGARLYLSDEGDENWKYRYLDGYDHELLRDGDSFKIGNILFEVMHTPGHTPEHISLLLTDTVGAEEPMGIFTGDFVFVGDVGRPDLLEQAVGIAATAEPGAHEMFHSLQRFKALPDYLQVWPGHGAGSACGKALGAIPSSTVGYEKRFNWAMQEDDEDAFVRTLLSGQPEPPRYFAMMKRLNKEGPRVLHGQPLPEHLPFSRLPTLLEEGAVVVDTRSASAFAASHIPGTINIPVDSSFATWAGWILDYETPYYLLVEPHLLEAAISALYSIGLDNVAGYFEASTVDAWLESGQPLQSYEVVSPSQVAEPILNGEMTVLDVRNLTEWEGGHLPGAKHIMLGYLPDRVEEVPTDRPVVVHCLTGARSAIGASILQATGVPHVLNLMGGFREWAAAGLPVVGNGSG
ncbi:MAG: rhodanese-like domain-containing protein [Chloroflexota bacterium]|nr:rhodanese-like domain-containing protein [Chloroflexota bacterium]